MCYPTTGGTDPFVWSIIGGSLPSGLSLTTSGTIMGTPTVAATYTFTVKVIDANANSDSATFDVNIKP